MFGLIQTTAISNTIGLELHGFLFKILELQRSRNSSGSSGISCGGSSVQRRRQHKLQQMAKTVSTAKLRNQLAVRMLKVIFGLIPMMTTSFIDLLAVHGRGFTLGDGALASISANKLTAGTIDASVITVSNINAGNISTGSLAADRISANSITGGKLSSRNY
jgi:hypothetical protein